MLKQHSNLRVLTVTPWRSSYLPVYVALLIHPLGCDMSSTWNGKGKLWQCLRWLCSNAKCPDPALSHILPHMLIDCRNSCILSWSSTYAGSLNCTVGNVGDRRLPPLPMQSWVMSKTDVVSFGFWAHKWNIIRKTLGCSKMAHLAILKMGFLSCP